MLNEVDSITTAAQAQQFVRAHQEYLPGFVIQKMPDEAECAGLQKCPDFQKSASWMKADFDGNGLTDLLAVGYASKESFRRVIICLLDSGHHRYGSTRLNFYNVYPRCTLPALIQVAGKPAIRYLKLLASSDSNSTRKAVCQVDTLIYDTTQFVEYSAKRTSHQIEYIAFNSTRCYGRCPVVAIEIDSNGVATYEAGKFNKKEGKFAAIIDKQRLKQLVKAINNTNFTVLKDNYRISATDHPTCTLTITYDQGKVKTIEDYGEQGTLGLERVYDLLFALRDNQNWK